MKARSTIRATLLQLTAGAALAALAAPAHAGECRAIKGLFEETPITGPACTSPVGLCSAVQIYGQFKGVARFTATSLTPSGDTPATGVVFVTGDTVVSEARLGGRRGSVFIKNAAAYRTVGGFDLTDTQVIVGGTQGFAGVTGALRATGNFVPGSGGVSEFEGVFCLP
jgi:hypothetical protein